jgi:creatinine amidohydrolase/Fe(II)-dependent formamide hydrolase-like protein
LQIGEKSLSSGAMSPLLRYDHATLADLLITPVRDDVLVLAVAAPENHGPHLPLGTDAILSEEMARRVGAELADAYPTRRVWLHPTWPLGSATIRGPGSVKVPSRLLRRTLDAYLRRFVRQGFHHFVLLSAHGGVPHSGTLDDVCARLRRLGTPARPVHAVAPSARVAGKAFFGGYAEAVRAAGVPLTDAEIAELIWDLHAGRLETSMMLAAAPTLVDAGFRRLPDIRPPERRWLRAVQRSLARWATRFAESDERREGMLHGLALGVEDLSWILRGRLEGYVGRPALASAVEGEALLAAVASDITHHVREVFDGRLDPLALRSAAFLFRWTVAIAAAVVVGLTGLVAWWLF